jgi:hypothetical protein
VFVFSLRNSQTVSALLPIIGGTVPTEPKEYLSKAQECEHLAARSDDPEMKQLLALMARLWRAFAELRNKPDDG